MKVLLSALFFLLAGINNGIAEEIRYYDVEIIVFENQDAGAKSSEHWPLEVNINKPVNTVELGMPPQSEWLPIDADLSISFQELPAENYQLTAEVEKIANSNSRRVLFHRAWRQPGLDHKIAIPVYFKQATSSIALDNDRPPLTETAAENTAPLEPAANVATLEGLFRVSLSRYLHLEAELIYRDKTYPLVSTENTDTSESFFYEEPAPETNTENKPGVIYLKQTRNRMKSNELHYIDHPVLGILVKIMPYIKPEE